MSQIPAVSVNGVTLLIFFLLLTQWQRKKCKKQYSDYNVSMTDKHSLFTLTTTDMYH